MDHTDKACDVEGMQKALVRLQASTDLATIAFDDGDYMALEYAIGRVERAASDLKARVVSYRRGCSYVS